MLVPTLPPPKGASPKSKSKRFKGVVFFLACAVFGGVVGYLGARFAAQLFLPGTSGVGMKLLHLLSLPLVWLVVVTWHELGHVLGGKLTGGQLLLFIVGPFKWARTPSGLRFGFNRSINLGGGLAACLPLEERDLPRRMAIMIAGGPVASVVLTVLALWISAWSAAHGWAFVQKLTMTTALISGVIFVVTAIPGQAGGFRTDGRRLVELVRGGPRAEQEAALLSLTVAGLAGVRPADFSPKKIAAAIGVDDGSLNALYGHFNAYSHHADVGDFGRAQGHLDRLVAEEDQLPPFMRDMVRADYAWLLAQPGGDVAAARAWLETAGKVEFDPATKLRAEAAVLLAEGRCDEAAVKAREGLVALETKSLSPVKSQFAAEALETILLRATSASG